jgi:hypothetical protein
MAQEKQQQSGENVNVSGGINTDASLLTQPEGTTRFVFTGVDETKEGDSGFISNEESNASCYVLPIFPKLPTSGGTPYVPIGKVYIGDEKNALFLAHSSGNSIIAVLDKECNLTIAVDDSNQTEKLGFKISHQIDATFRLRRGCERTVYWVDPKPRLFCFDREEKFKDPLTGKWDINKFGLFKKYQDIPQFSSVEVIEGAGILPPGSYNFAIRYLDQDFNPTPFINSCETVSIYNSSTSIAYRSIRGSTKEVNDYQKFTDTNKAIKLQLSNLDTTYPFYSIAIIEANTGLGQISSTKITAPIGTDNNVFIYTGTNFQQEISIAEITTFLDDIESAETIEQIENRLVLGNTKSKQINYCKLQKYASKINVDVITREVFTTSLDSSSAKDPSLHNHGVGYMPGEIYSLGVVWIFDDYSESPAFHIPGKNPGLPTNTIFSPGLNVYPMRNNNNISARDTNLCVDTKYTDNNTCLGEDYWGKDSIGTPLKNTSVRHHRLPLRTDIGVPMITEVPQNVSSTYFKNIKIKISGTITVPRVCTTAEVSSGCTPTTEPPFLVKVDYTEDGASNTITNVIDPLDWAAGPGEPLTHYINKTITSNLIISSLVLFVNIYEEDILTPLVMTYSPSTGIYSNAIVSPKGLTYEISIVQSTANNTEKVYKTQMLGLKFSNIDAPASHDLGGKKVIGYYIVRHERTEEERTILDSAVVFPTLKYSSFISHGLLKPETLNSTIFKKDIVSFVNPEFKFNGRNYTNFTSLIHQGTNVPSDVTKSRTKINDVSDGSGYDPDHHKHGRSDDDGFTIQIKTRDTFYDHNLINNFTVPFSDIEEVFYLNALENKALTSTTNLEDVFNLACDNKVGIVKTTADFPTFVTGTNIPYVYLHRQNLNPYSNFRLDSMYKESNNPVYFGSTTIGATTTTFNGDSYVSSIKYVNSIFYDNRMKQRVGQTSIWNYVVSYYLVAIAVALAIFSGGTGIAVSIALIGAATALTMSGIKQDAWNKAYNELYNKGLRATITDDYMLYDVDPNNNEERGFSKNPTDDEIQWLGDAANLWFESSVNMGLRNGATNSTPDFVNAPAKIESGTTAGEWDDEFFGTHSVGNGGDILPTNSLDTHMLVKLTILDTNRKSGRAYIGLSLAEIYTINKDYIRRNKQKVFYPLGLDYDCCSECVETFPHRWSWSEQAFQEELTDNFRTFLPNNYKDLEAETGPITDMYRIQNSLFIHTTEGLWHCPQTFQERVTSDVISFIGTGEYFSIPPRKIVDDSNSSAGNSHKWARTKTKFGVLFPSHKEKKWYLFEGQKLQPITDNGNYSWFKNNMRFLAEENYYNATLQKYPYSNNPSNPIGVGYLSTYDTVKERLIVTKKDIVLNGLPSSNYELCNEGGNTIYFPNFSTILATRLAAGWNYIGMENCNLKFEKVITTSVPHTRTISVWVPPVTTAEPMDPTCIKVSKLFFNVTFSPVDDKIGGSAIVTLIDCSGQTHIGFGSADINHSGMIKLFLNTCVSFNEFGPEYQAELSEGISITPIVTKENGPCETYVTTPGYWSNSVETYYVNEYTNVYEYVNGTTLNTTMYPPINNGWTMSYSLKRQEWRSWHPYIPSFYMHVQEKFYSWPQGSTSLWKHNVQGNYQTFYGVRYPFIVEYVDNPGPIINKLWDSIMFQTEAKKYDATTQDYNDQRNITFNKVLLYNTEQISGELTLVPKQNTSEDYLYQQTKNLSGNQITIDRNERDWTMNNMRDLRDDYTIPMFIKNVAQLQSNYYIDKVVNPLAINYNKDWTQLASFRDKYLVVRLIFDNFADVRLAFNFSVLAKQQSER